MLRILMLSAPMQIQGPLPKLAPLLMQALRDLGCKVEYEPWGRHNDQEGLPAKTVGRLGDLLRIRSRLKREQIDLLVIHTSHDWPAVLRDVPLLQSTRGVRPATVLQLHGSHPDRLLGKGHFLYKRLSGRLVRMCDAVLLLSDEERRQWERFCPAGKFHVVRNPYVRDTASMEAPSGPLWTLPPGVPVLLFVGRLIPEKGVLDLVDAFARLKARVACHLLIAGDGACRQQVQERVSMLGLDGYVTVAGYLTGGALAAAYRAASVFVLPTYWAEGFPMVISEAMDAGLPIVTTQLRGVADQLRAEVNVLFVPPRDPGVLADVLERLLSDPALRAQMSEANRAQVRELAPEVVGRHYLWVLEQVLEARSVKP